MKQVVLVIASIALLATPAISSDFSKLGEPAFARTLMLSGERQEEALCVSLALEQSRSTALFSADEAAVMVDIMIKRLVEEVGDEGHARELIDGRASWFDLADYEDPEHKKERADQKADFVKQCTPLFDAFRSGGAKAFAAKLKPTSGLIPLLPLPKCLALAEYVPTVDPHSMFGKDELADLRKLAHEGMAPRQIASLDAEVAAERASLARDKPDVEALGVKPIACLATFRQRAVEAGRTSF